MTPDEREYWEHMRALAQVYLSHENRDIRDMALLVLATSREKLA